MAVSIKVDPTYGEATITVIGVTDYYGHRQFILVNSDEGQTKELKFPGLKFQAPLTSRQTLEDVAVDRFEEQTGLHVDKSLGLRVIVPTRSRHKHPNHDRGQWMFRNVFLGVVKDLSKRKDNDGRKVYVADPGQGCFPCIEYVHPIGETRKRTRLEWVIDDNMIVARSARDMIHHLNKNLSSTNWYPKIPCVGAKPLSDDKYRPHGCGLAVANMILLYQPSPKEHQMVIMVKRKGDKFPGYAGGKIETLLSEESENLDPVSCCAKEGSEEFGFEIKPKALVGVATTALQVPIGQEKEHYKCLVTYSFVAEAVNPRRVKQALANPSAYLEGKMECYVVEKLDEHRDRLMHKEIRMPDMISLGNLFYASGPGGKIPLTCIRSSGYD